MKWLRHENTISSLRTECPEPQVSSLSCLLVQPAVRPVRIVSQKAVEL